MVPDEDFVADAELFAGLRAMWEERDPVPAGLIDRMVAAIAVEDLSREYAMLTLVEGDYADVRGFSDTATLQFSDGKTSILLHVTAAEDGAHRIDGWVDAEARRVRLVQGDRDIATDVGAHGRFAFDGVRTGLTRVRLSVIGADGTSVEFQTPQFEI